MDLRFLKLNASAIATPRATETRELINSVELVMLSNDADVKSSTDDTLFPFVAELELVEICSAVL